MELKGSKTEANLLAAFSGESMARNKYTYYASKAKQEGYEQIAQLFEETANNEKAHAKIWFKLLHDDMIPDTEANLKDGVAGENYEHDIMYAEFAKVAREEGFTKIAALFEGVGQVEKDHAERYVTLLENLQAKRIFEKEEAIVWYCSNCGHLHKGTHAPKICPVCVHPQAYFYQKSDNYK